MLLLGGKRIERNPSIFIDARLSSHGQFSTMSVCTWAHLGSGERVKKPVKGIRLLGFQLERAPVNGSYSAVEERKILEGLLKRHCGGLMPIFPTRWEVCCDFSCRYTAIKHHQVQLALNMTSLKMRWQKLAAY